MHIHEYQAKELLKKFGINSPKGAVACCYEEVKKIISSLRLKEGVIKAQIHAGGRKKIGAIKIARTPQEILENANNILGQTFVNNQTGSKGLTSHLVLVEEIVDIQNEYYICIMFDRTIGKIVLLCSKEGGIDIESQKAQNPNKILKVILEDNGKIKVFDLIKILKFMSWTHALKHKAIELIKSVINTFIFSDAVLVEINPLVLTKENKFVALDAKMTIDDNALFRQPQIATFYDPTQLTSLEVKARKFNLSYVPLKGNIGCLVNGAGLAMATLDLLNYFGGEPANFLDLGGTADKNRICEGFKILLQDTKVKSIFVHIFGGVMDCEIVSDGILEALNSFGSSKKNIPIIVRMEGSNRQAGNYKLIESKFNIIALDNLVNAARQAIIKAGIL